MRPDGVHIVHNPLLSVPLVGARVTLTAIDTSGQRSACATVLAKNRNAADPRFLEWHGVANPFGEYTWASLDTGVVADLYDFEAWNIDHDGIRTSGKITERISGGGSVQLTVYLKPDFLAKLTLPEPALRYLRRSEDGGRVLASVAELQSAVTAGMVRATIQLSTVVIEGLIRVRARATNIWDTAWENSTYGQLVSLRPIRAMLPAEVEARAMALADLRPPSAHLKATDALPGEAQTAVRTVEDLLAAWCKWPVFRPDWVSADASSWRVVPPRRRLKKSQESR